jgi:antitoxin component of MazEF toxin-antitoxin module
MITQMKEKATLRQVGNSTALTLKKSVLLVYNLKAGDDVEINYEYPTIIIKKWEETEAHKDDDKK